jgi:SAM-dependent methyltransferase
MMLNASQDDERRRAQRFFNKTAAAFRVIERVVVPEYRDLVARLGLDTAWSVLDVGTGTGAFAQVFAERGHPVVGVDFSERLLARAKRRVPGVRFEHADVLVPGALAGRTFDLVTMGYVLHGMSMNLRLDLLDRVRAIARRHVLIVDYAGPGTWLTRWVEWVEGPHYFEFIRTPLSSTLLRAGLGVTRRGRTKTGGGYWLCFDRGHRSAPDRR